jgi:hypothetical protein
MVFKVSVRKRVPLSGRVAHQDSIANQSQVELRPAVRQRFLARKVCRILQGLSHRRKCPGKTDETVHPEWESSKDVARSTGEKFYIREVQQSDKQYVPEGQEEDKDPIPAVIVGTESERTPYQPFTGPYECHFFQENLQGHFKKSHEASEDRRSLATLYGMPRFAKWWEEQVKANELLDIDERK